jgi:hypothetical protein
MISRNLTKLLEQLEGRMLPSREIHLLRVVNAKGADSAPVGGYTVGHGYGSQSQALGAGSQGRASRGEWGICLRP